MNYCKPRLLVVLAVVSSYFPNHSGAQPSQNLSELPNVYSNVGTPLTKVYTAKQHGGHNQNWTSFQSSDGLIYVGHTSGISQWDGEHWHNFTTPHATPVRSITEFQGDLYFGTNNDIFKLYLNQAGELTTQSLLDTLPENVGEFGEVWAAVANSLGVVFVSPKHTFFYDGKTLKLIDEAISSKHFLFNVDDAFYYKTRHLPEIYKLETTRVNGTINIQQRIMPYKLPANARVMEILNSPNNTLVVVTEDHGIFEVINNRLLQKVTPEQVGVDSQLYDAILSSDGFYYVGSTFNGLFIFDAQLNLVRHYNEQDGISMNTIFSVNEDRQGNLWLTGIPNVVKMRPPHIISQFKAGNASTEILRLKNTPLGLIATGNGQFSLALPNDSVNESVVRTPKFIPLSDNIESSTDIIEYDGALIRAGHDGIYELQLNQAENAIIAEQQLIDTSLGRALALDANNQILVSATEGAFILKKEQLEKDKNRWQVLAFPSAIKFLVSLGLDKDDTLWLGSATGRLFKLDNVSKHGVNAELTTFDEADGLGQGPVEIFTVDGNALFSSAGKLLQYQQGKLQQTNLPMFTPSWLENSQTIDRIVQTPATVNSPQRVWFRKNGRSGYFFEQAIGQWQTSTLIFDSVEPGGFSDLLVTPNDILWFVRDNGEIYRVDINLAEQMPAIAPVNIRRLESSNQLINFSAGEADLISLLPEQQNLRFSYASTDNSSPTPSQYRTRLIGGSNEQWSNWTPETYRDFSQLSPQQYQFVIQAKDGWGRVSETQLNFVVSAPWYLTKVAYAVYLVLGLLLIFAFTYVVQKWRTRKLEAANLILEAKIEQRTQEVSEKVEQLRQQQILKDRFFGNVSHEFRTPLTLTIGPLETIFTEHKAELSNAVSHLAKMALNNASKMLALVGQVLDLNRLEAGKLPLRIAQYDMAELLRNISQRFQPWAEQNQQHITVIDCENPMLLWFDIDQFDKCVSNLLSNAIKYSGQSTTIKVQLKRHAEFVDVLVQDNGVGISTDAKEKVFERFFQDKTSENVSAPGTGIGLSLVKEIMQLHHGDAKLVEHNEQGCCFVLSVKMGNEHFEPEQIIEPIAHDHDKHTVYELPSENTQIAHNSATSEEEDVTTLLIVDDNKELLNFISLRLSASYRILQANNGQEGYDIACSELPDLIVSDVNMPVMTGLELAKQLKANKVTHTIPIILLTAQATKRQVVEGFTVGADDYLTKPFDTSELIMRVNAQINSRKLIRDSMVTELSETSDNSSLDSFEAKLSHIVQQKLADPTFKVEQLAQALHMSRDTLIRKCKKSYGQTPLNIIVEQRMQKADDLLRQNTLSVSEVAYACGFESLAYFSKSYKKYRGVSPTEALNR